ncbi:hypothetical protein FDP41_013547 [Naegleria fowleri]|uniref:Uncharacterized protein n=1 Tax=Naegleria fowleri TaxID=5763 RepID=A0A6A5BQK1_NAEFO|nr:uncharacterized protein FDP41_013547 [Naegleria fowleri]KAF0980333.1 hypothetical protein FDP41_013547 [Naegleria fowleri]
MGGNSISKVLSGFAMKHVPKQHVATKSSSNILSSSSSSSATTNSILNNHSNNNIKESFYGINDGTSFQQLAQQQASKPIGDSNRKIRLVSFNLPEQDVKYVSKEDYDVMKEWKDRITQHGDEGLKQVEMEMNEINQMNLEQRKLWEEEELKEQYKISRGVAADTSFVIDDTSHGSSLTPEQELLNKLMSSSGGSSGSSGSGGTDGGNHSAVVVARDLLREETRNTLNHSSNEEMKNDDESLVSQDKDIDFVNSLHTLTNQLQVQFNEIPETTIEDYKKVIGKARARPLFEELHQQDDHRVYLPHNNTLNLGEEKEEMARRMAYLGHVNNPNAIRNQSFPETFRDVELRRLCDQIRELEFRMNQKDSSVDDEIETLIQNFAQQHSMKVEALKNILKYVNSVYVFSPHLSNSREVESYGFWNKIDRI